MIKVVKLLLMLLSVIILRFTVVRDAFSQIKASALNLLYFILSANSFEFIKFAHQDTAHKLTVCVSVSTKLSKILFVSYLINLCSHLGICI